MTAQIIAIGDEILIGQTLDTNSQYIAQQLTEIGIEVLSIQAIADTEKSIRSVLQNPQADILIFTGGLGPTQDDITKKTVTDFFETTLETHSEVLQNIKDLLKRKGRSELNILNQLQAEIPAIAVPLMNTVGTAPGMWIEQDGRIFIFMPGIPFEMKYLMTHEVLPRLQQYSTTRPSFRKNVLIFGIPESELALQLQNWEQQLPEDMSVAYLPTAGVVKMRLTYRHTISQEAENTLNQQLDALQNLLGNALLSIEGEDLPTIIGQILVQKKWSIATAESFTTGRIITELTSVSGSSQYVKGGIVPYQIPIKEAVLHIDSQWISENSVVSEAMAVKMAKKAQEIFQSDIVISSTGVAGPTTDAHHPQIGTAYIGICIKQNVYTQKFNYPELERNEFAQLIARKAIEFLFTLLT